MSEKVIKVKFAGKHETLKRGVSGGPFMPGEERMVSEAEAAIIRGGNDAEFTFPSENAGKKGKEK